MLFLILWLLIGFYGALMNYERIPRVFPTIGHEDFDLFQHFITLVLGPIGVLLVLAHGGRLDFWRKRR